METNKIATKLKALGMQEHFHNEDSDLIERLVNEVHIYKQRFKQIQEEKEQE